MKYAACVIPGRGEGHRIGFPTINLEIPDDFDAEYGVYAGWAWLEGKKMPAAIHYGPVPVFGVEQASLEAHIIDADIIETPEEISIELIKRLRDIGHIPGIEALKKQIGEDVSAARNILEGV